MTNEQLNNGMIQPNGVNEQTTQQGGTPVYTNQSVPQQGYVQQPVYSEQPTQIAGTTQQVTTNYPTQQENAQQVQAQPTVEQQPVYTQYQQHAPVQQQTYVQPQQEVTQTQQAVTQQPVVEQQPVQTAVASAPIPTDTYVNTPVSPSSIQRVEQSALTASGNGMYMLQVDIMADIGNSGSRVVVDTPTTRFYFELDNHYAYIDDISKVDAKYFNERTTIIKDTHSDGYFANGQLVDVEYPSSDKPIGFKEKAAQPVTYTTLRTIIARSAIILAKHFNVSLDELNLGVSLHVLFPPLRAKEQGDILQQNMQAYGLNRIEMLSPVQLNKEIRLTIHQKAEGISGFVYSFYKEEGVVSLTNSPVDFKAGQYEVYDMQNAKMDIIAENMDFHIGDFLVMDIGAGTSDLVLGRNLEIIESSRETFTIGGNSVETNIMQQVRKDMGMTLNPTHLLEIMTTGKFTEGSLEHNAIPYISNARKKYAEAFKQRLIEYFDAQMYEPRHLKGLLVFGGGSLETRNEKENSVADAMVKIIIDFLKEDLCPNIREIATDKKNARRANVLGAAMLARY